MELEFDFETPVIDERKRKGYSCPCCNRFVKLYTRSFNSNMAVALICLYKSGELGYVHMEELLRKNGHQRCGDFSYMQHYRLIEKLVEDRKDQSSRNGYYKITSLGILFCEMKWKVKEKFLIFQNKCEGFEGKEIDIVEALGTKFRYDDLIKN